MLLGLEVGFALRTGLRDGFDIESLLDLRLDLVLFGLNPLLKRQGIFQSQPFPLFLELLLDCRSLHDLVAKLPSEHAEILNAAVLIAQEVVVEAALLIDRAHRLARHFDAKVLPERFAPHLLPADVGLPASSCLALVASIGDLVTETNHSTAVETSVGLLVPLSGSMGIGRDVLGEFLVGLACQ